MICPSCASEGTYREIEDLSHDGEWIYTTAWQCDSCDVYLNQYDDGFEWASSHYAPPFLFYKSKGD